MRFTVRGLTIRRVIFIIKGQRYALLLPVVARVLPMVAFRPSRTPPIDLA